MSLGLRVSRIKKSLLLAALAMPLAGAAQAPPATPAAGKITAIIPVDSVVRQRRPLPAVKDMPVLWGDTVKTERGGRVRVTLIDGSVINVGSQSAVVVQKHDPAAQQTDLQLVYGQMRSDVVKIVRPGGGFNVRTQAAVAGVIGTSEYLEATNIYMTVIALGGGDVAVRSSDPRFPDLVLLHPGETITAIVAHPLGQKRQATQEELQKAFQTTEAGSVGVLSPGQIAPGQSGAFTLSGSALNTVNSVTSSKAGIQAQITGTPTATQAAVTITVAQDVATGTYPLTFQTAGGTVSALLVVASTPLPVSGTSGGTTGQLQPPPSQSYTVNQGTKLSLDASGTSTPSGTQILAYQWEVSGTGGQTIPTQLSSNQSNFVVDTSLLPPGNYTIQLVVVNDRGQTATQQFPLTVVAVAQPADIIAQLATAYESLQPSQFLVNFDEQRFPNYAGFAQAIQDSFLNKLQSVRVFQRPVNCSQSQGQAVCQADFQVQFTLKSEATQFIDSNGNPVPPGTPGAVLGKPIESGNEQATISFFQGDAGWKIIGYSAQVTCPGGTATSGVNVGSCILAAGSSQTASFQLTNLTVPSTQLFLGSTLTGSFLVTSSGGFTGSVSFTAQGQVGDQTVSVSFSPNPSGPSGTVNFTVTAPTTIPTGFTGSQTFTLSITGTSGSLSSSLSQQFTLAGGFLISATPGASSGSPATAAPATTLNLNVTVTGVTGFTGSVSVGLLNPPTGFSAAPITLTPSTGGPATGTLAVTLASNTPVTNGTPIQLTLQGTSGSIQVSVPVFVNVVFPFTLTPTVTGSPVLQGGSFTISVAVGAAGGFSGTVSLSLPNLPTGLSITSGPSGAVATGGTGVFTIAVGTNAATGTDTLAVTGTATVNESLTTSVPASVIVGAVASFSLSVSPGGSAGSPAQAAPSSALNLTVTVTPLNGFTGTVTVDLTNPPTGLSATSVPISVTGSTPVTGTLAVQVALTTPLTSTALQLSLQGTSGSLQASTNAFVNIVFPYTLAVSPATSSTSPAQVAPNSTLALMLTFTSVAGFNGAVNFSLLNPPTGITAGSGTTTLTPGATGSATLNVSIGALSTGALNFVLQTSVSGQSSLAVNSTVFINVTGTVSFAIAIEPATSSASPINVVPTNTLGLTVQVTPLNGFTGTVTISLQSATGATGEFTASSTSVTITGGSSVNVTLNVAVNPVSSGGTGANQLVIAAASGSSTQTSTVFVNVLFPFSLNVTPATTSSTPLDEGQGTTFNVLVQVVPVLGFNGSVNVTFPSAPSFLSVTGGTVAAGATGTFPVTVSGSAPTGAAQLNVTGTYAAAALAQSGQVFLNVTGPAPFQIQQPSSVTAPLALVAGSSAVLGVTVNATSSSFVGSVTLSFGPMPAGVTVSPTTATVTAGVTQNFTFSFSSTNNPNANFGFSQITLTGTASGQPTQTTDVVLNLTPSSTAAFSLTNTNPTTSPLIIALPSGQVISGNAGGGGSSFDVNVSPATFNQPVTVSIGSLPAGVTTSLNSVTFTPSLSNQGSGMASFDLLVNPSLAVAGTYTIQVSGNSGGATATTTVGLVLEGSFTVSVSPSTTQNAPLLVPNSGTFPAVTATVASLNGFAGTVTVTMTLPASLPTVTFASGSATQTVTLTAGGQATATYTLKDTATTAVNSAAAAATISASSSSGPQLAGNPQVYLATGASDFTVTLSPNAVTRAAGQGGGNIPVNAVVSPLSGFTGAVNLTVNASSVPTGVEVQPTAITVQTGGTGQFFPSAHGSATPGNFPNVEIDGQATTGGPTHAFLLNVTVQGQISINVTDQATNGAPGTQTNPIILPPNTSHTFVVTLNGNSYSGTMAVQAQVTNLTDPNLTAKFTSSGTSTGTFNVPGNGSVQDTLTLSTNASGLSFNFEQIGVQASNTAGLTSTIASQTIYVASNVPGFTLGCDLGNAEAFNCSSLPMFLNINQAGSVGTLQIRADSSNNLRDPVKVVPVGLPAGITMTPSQLLITPQNALAGTDVPVTFTAASPATPGSFSFTLQGTDTVNTALTSSTTVQINLQGSIQVAVASPVTGPTSPVLIAAGGSQVFTLNVTGQNGFSGSATITPSFPFPGPPFAATITPSFQTVTVPATGSVQTTFTIGVPAGTPASAPIAVLFDSSGTPQTYFVPGQTNVQGYFAAGTSSFAVQIFGPGSSLSQPVAVPIGQQNSIFEFLGTAGQLNAQIIPLGGFGGTVTLDVSGLPAGVDVSFQPTPFFGAKKATTTSRSADFPTNGAPVNATLVFTAQSTAPAGIAQATLTATAGSISQSIPISLLVVPQFSLSFTPSLPAGTSLVIAPGASTTLQIGASATSSFSGAVDLFFLGTPAVTPATPRVPIGGSVTETISIPSTATAGTLLTSTVCVSFNGLTVFCSVIPIQVGSAGFNVSVGPASATSPSTPVVVTPGGAAVNVTATVTPQGNFTSPVTLTATFQGDSGSLSTPNPTQTVNGGSGTVTFPVSAASTAPGVTALMLITASANSTTVTQVIAYVSIGSGGFSLMPVFGLTSGQAGTAITSSNPFVIDINASSFAPNQIAVEVGSQSGFTGAVTLSATGIPAGVTLTPNNVTVPGAGTCPASFIPVFASTTTAANTCVQTITLTANSGAPLGASSFTITGTSGSKTVTTTVFLLIRGVYTLNLSAGGSSAAPIAISPNSSQTFTVSFAPVNFSSLGTGSVVVNVANASGLPTGISVSPSTATLTAAATSATFTLSATSSAQASGEQTVVFTSSSAVGTAQPGATLFYSVGTTPTFNLSVGPAGGSVLGVLIGNTNGNQEFATITPVDGFTGSVSLIVGGLPTGVTASPQAVTVSLAGTPVTIPIAIKADSTVQPGFTSAVTVTATNAANPFVASKGSASTRTNANSASTITVGPLSLNINLLGDYQLIPTGGQNISSGNGLSATDPAILTPGTTATVNFNVNALDNFGNNTVNLSASGSLPTGITASITATATASTPGVLSITVPSTVTSTPVFPITVTATSNLAFTNPQTFTGYFIVSNGTPSISLIPPSSPVPVVIGSGQFTSYNVVLSGLAGSTTQTLTITSVSGTVPAGVTITPTIGTASVKGSIGGATLTFQVKADPPAVAGPAQFTIQGTLGTTTTTAVVQLDLLGSYSVNITPTNSAAQPTVITPGQSQTFNVAIVPQNGFNGTVTLTLSVVNFTCPNCPLGSTFLNGVTFPNTLTASPSSPGQIVVSTTTGSAASPTVQLGYQGSASDVASNATATVNFAVGPPSFTVNVFCPFTVFNTPQFPAAVPINGPPTMANVQITSLGGFSGSGSFALGALPTGLTVSPQGGAGTLQVNSNGGTNGGVSLTFQAGSQAVEGPVSVPFTATIGGTTVTGFVYLDITPNLSLVANPVTSSSSPLLLAPGSGTGQNVTVTLESLGGVSPGTIPLTVSNVPSGFTVTSNPNPPNVAPGGSVTFTVTASSTAATGLQTITISTSFGGLTVQTQVFFFVGTGNFSFGLSPASSSSNPIVVIPGTGNNGPPVAVTVQPVDGFTGNVTLTANLPSGVGGFFLSNSGSSITIAAGQTTTFIFTASTALGTTPVQATFTGTSGTLSNISPAVTLLVNPPAVALTGVPAFTLTQGNLTPVAGNISLTNNTTAAVTETLTFLNPPQGINISPLSQTVSLAASATGTAPITVFADSTAALGVTDMQLVVTCGTQSNVVLMQVTVGAATAGFFFTSNPPTSVAAPLLLQPSSTLISFVDINVNSLSGFSGTVTLSASGVPGGVTATLVPSSATLTSGGVQVVQLQLQTTSGLAAFAATPILVSGQSGSTSANINVFVALQSTSSLAKGHSGGSVAAPQVSDVQPAMGLPGTYTTVTIQGQSLSGVSSVLADTQQISGKLEPGATDQQLQVSVFVSPHTRVGRHSLLLIGPAGSVPLAFAVGVPVGNLQDAEFPGNKLRSRLRQNGDVAQEADLADAASAAPAVSGVTPAQIQAGGATDAQLIGNNLRGVTAVQVAGEGIRAQVISTQDSQVQVRFTVDASATPGSRVLTIQAGGQSFTAVVNVAAAAPTTQPTTAQAKNTTAAQVDQNTSQAEAAATPVLRLSEMSMTPAKPKQGDTITFQARVTNAGSVAMQNVPIQFTMAGTRIQATQQISLGPGESQTVAFQWQALRGGIFQPQVVIDPQNTIAGLDRSQTKGNFPEFELAEAPAPAVPVSHASAVRERGELSVTLGGCAGLRLSTGNETSCGAGDVQVHLSSPGGVLRFEADRIGNLGIMPLERIETAPRGAFGMSENVVSGATYLIVAGNQAYAVRVTQIRGLESARNAPPPALRGPKIGGFEAGARAGAESGTVTLALEWKQLTPRQ